MRRLVISLLISGILISCKSEVKHFKAYRGIQIPSKTSILADTLDKLFKENQLAVTKFSDGSPLLAFPEKFNGVPFYSCLTLKYDHSVLVGLTVDFMNDKDFLNVPSRELNDNSLTKMEQVMWFSNPLESDLINHKFENYLFESLKLKYGSSYTTGSTPSTYVSSNGFRTNLETQELKWEDGGLIVRFKKVIEKNYNNVKLVIDYSLSDLYLKEHKKALDQWKKDESAF